jgi:hypothetical protein
MKKLTVSIVIIIALAAIAGQAFAQGCNMPNMKCGSEKTSAAATVPAAGVQTLPPAENLLQLTGTVISIAPNGAALVDTGTARVYVLAQSASTAEGTAPVSPFKVGERIQVSGMLLALSVQPAPAATTAAAEYICTMCPDVHATKPGRCPKCGMNLVKKTN